MDSILLLLPAFGCSDETVGPQSHDLVPVELSVEPANLVLPVADGLQLVVSMTGADATPLGAAGA